MPNPVEGLLEVYENIVEVLLVLEVFLTEDSKVKDLLCGASSCSEACLFFSSDLLHLRFQSVQHDLQHDFAWVTDEADHSAVLALLYAAFLGKCDYQGLGWPFSCLPDLVVRVVITSSPLARISSPGLLSTPADFLFFSDCTAASLYFAKDGVVILCVSQETVQY